MTKSTEYVEIDAWLRTELFTRCRAPHTVCDDMIAAGWDSTTANTLVSNLIKTPPVVEHVIAAPAFPWPTITNDPSKVFAYDKDVGISVICEDPKLIVFTDVLSNEECDQLLELARPTLVRSTTVDNETGGNAVHPARTSDGAYFSRGQTELIERIEKRLAALVNWPYEFGEGIQVLRYRNGAEYLPHYDYFDPAFPGSAKITAQAGNRVGTFVMYLETPIAGGYTVFPDVKLRVAAQKGTAAFFAYEPNPGSKTLHGGQAVTEGEKFVATKWLRQRKF